MRPTFVLLTATAVTLSAPALAGEEPLYQGAPTWVDVAVIPAAKGKGGTPLLIYDDQRRIEAGRLTAYQDRALRLDDPQTVTAAGTITASWLPDKGDLLVHEVSIVRGGQTIDVLGQGARFAVLRREEALEQRSLTGAMTATMTVPGLRVGDVLRLRYSTTTSDQTLKNQVQAMAPLPAAPFAAQLGRVQMSWPANAGIRWKATSDLKIDPVTRDGFQYVAVKLPLAKPEELPSDVPSRFRLPAVLQAGTFDDWPSISRLMAPLYDAKAVPVALAPEVARIKGASRDPLSRAVASLQLVQDQISYFANGLNGGNYQPQSAAETWDKRYGDCKAKTLLLLTLLHAMDIEAEPVVVASRTGDALPGLLPMPGDFDHIIVRARIGGKSYWLDGTSAGATLARIADVPNLGYGLPLRAAGSALEPMPMPPRTGYDATGLITFDQRAGLALPVLLTGEWTLSGPVAATIQAVISQGSADQLREMASNFVTGNLGDAKVYDSAVAYDPATRTATIRASGLMASPWTWVRNRGTQPLSLATTGFEFKPDRSRKAWQSLPVALPGPSAEKTDLTVLLPAGLPAFQLDGRPDIDARVAGAHLERHAQLAGDRLTVSDAISWTGGELPADQISDQRAAANRLGSMKLNLVAPAASNRMYLPIASGGRERVAAIDAAYDKIIALEPDDAQNYLYRASFRSSTFDLPGAIKDFAKAIELDPAAKNYRARAAAYVQMNKLDLALADAQKAAELDPSIAMTITYSEVLSLAGRHDQALALLKGLDPSGSEIRAVQLARGNAEALAGHAAAGMALVDAATADMPDDATILNERCWYRGTWNLDAGGLLDLCNRAVERGGGAPYVLDSRAMAYYRLGRLADARKQYDVVLAAAPDLAPSLFMRGVVRQAMGDAGGKTDVQAALMRDPSVAIRFARFGIVPH